MATIANLIVNLRANTGAFAAGMDRSARQVQSFTAVVQTARGVVTTAFAAMTAAVVAFGAASGINKALNDIDALAKRADSLGVATEALIGLEHAADLSGVAAEKLASSMARMLKAVNDVRSGSGAEAARAFEMMRVDVEALAAATPDRQLEMIADGIASIEDPTRRAAAAMGVFGRSGTELLPLLQAGGEGLREMREDAELLGLTFNRLDAGKVEEANDAVSRAKAAFGALARVAAINLAPTIRAIADQVTALARSVQSTGRIVLAAGTGIVEAGTRILGVLRPIVEAIVDAVKHHAKLVAYVTAGATAFIAGAAAARLFIGAIQATSKAIAIMQAVSGPKGWANLAAGAVAAGLAIIAVNAAFSELEASQDQIDAAQEGLAKVEASADAAANGVWDLGEATDDAARQMRALQLGWDLIAGNVERAREEAEILSRIMGERGFIGLTPDEAALRQLRQLGSSADTLAFARSEIAARRTAETAAAVRELTEGLAQQITVFGLSSRATQLYELQLRGATDAQLAMAASLTGLLDGMEAIAAAASMTDGLLLHRRVLGQLRADFEAGALSVDQYLGAIERADAALAGLQRTLDESLFDELSRAAVNLVDSLRSPLDRLRDTVDRLRDLVLVGLVSPDQFNRLLQREADAFASRPVQFASGIQRGSADDVRAEFAFQTRERRRDDVTRIIKDQLKTEQQNLEQLKRIAGLLGDSGSQPVANF